MKHILKYDVNYSFKTDRFWISWNLLGKTKVSLWRTEEAQLNCIKGATDKEEDSENNILQF